MTADPWLATVRDLAAWHGLGGLIVIERRGEYVLVIVDETTGSGGSADVERRRLNLAADLKADQPQLDIDLFVAHWERT